MSENTNTGQSRRGLLGRGFLIVAGAIGVGAGAGAVKLATDGSADSADRLQLYGRGWRLQTPDRKQGERLVAGEQGTVHGELVDSAGKTVGQFYGSRVAIQSGVPGPIVADGSMELHTFKLEDGTIHGIGSTIAGESIFSIAGGTGRYAGSRGHYVAQQRLRELGGDGTAEFTIDLRA